MILGDKPLISEVILSQLVSECDTYRKVKVDYMKPGGLL
jgi:hypothetical protein